MLDDTASDSAKPVPANRSSSLANDSSRMPPPIPRRPVPSNSSRNMPASVESRSDDPSVSKL
jgi:hypothetical protein